VLGQHLGVRSMVLPERPAGTDGAGEPGEHWFSPDVMVGTPWAGLRAAEG